MVDYQQLLATIELKADEGVNELKGIPVTSQKFATTLENVMACVQIMNNVVKGKQEQTKKRSANKKEEKKEEETK